MPELDPNTPHSPDGMERLARSIETLTKLNIVKVHNSPWRMMWYQFLRGLALGLGTVIGASALVSILVLVLSQFEFVPVIGSWATQIIQEIDQSVK